MTVWYSKAEVMSKCQGTLWSGIGTATFGVRAAGSRLFVWGPYKPLNGFRVQGQGHRVYLTPKLKGYYAAYFWHPGRPDPKLNYLFGFRVRSNLRACEWQLGSCII